MNLEILFLSIIQGISEILPISSSVNLYFFSKLWNTSSFCFGLKIALHIGSLITFIIYFKKEIGSIFAAIFTKKTRLSDTYFYALIIGTIPVVILGFLALNFVKEFDSKVAIGASCILFGCLLLACDKLSIARARSGDKSKVPVWKAFIIGCFQAISIFPGVSRLGICISASRMLHIDRKKSITFSMLLAIPSIFGSMILEIIDCNRRNNFSIFSLESLMGILLTMIIGLIVIFPCVKYMEKNGFTYLVIYRILIGFLMILL
ncbi:MAG: undecaprenyl-diphosphate phosphatase [Holosporales bacterium]|jgi:undecaprenyl-diphosphatase|nr:undecaprenyl-diphosphate phosphatase [Holosporales bacterium]